MKSARMLVIAVAWLGLLSAGCTGMQMGIAFPVSTTRPASNGSTANDTLVNRVHGDTVTPAVGDRPADKAGDAAARTRADGNADSSDPQVVALTQRIGSLAGRLGDDKTGRTSTSDDRTNTRPTTTAPADVQPRDRSAGRGPQTPRTIAQVQGRDSSSAVPMTANVGVDTTAATSVPPAPQAAAGDPAMQSETTASPAPRAMPLIQPTPPSANAASLANVSVEIVDIRPVVTPVTSGTAAAAASANQPAQSDGTARASDLKGLIAQLEQSMQQKPPHPEDTLRLRLLYLAAGQDEQAVAPIKDADPVQAELLAAIVKAVASSRQAMLAPQNSSPAALNAAEELHRLISQQSGVTIPRLALVTKVTSYGDYEAISPARFKAGGEIHAYVYTEIANFRSEPVDGDRIHALLAEKVQVFDKTGKMIWERNEANIEDRVRTPRRDFFIPFPIHLSASLPAGDYVLKVTIEDRIGGTTDQQRLSFSIQ